MTVGCDYWNPARPRRAVCSCDEHINGPLRGKLLQKENALLRKQLKEIRAELIDAHKVRDVLLRIVAGL